MVAVEGAWFVRTDCAALATLDVVGNKWSALVIYALSRGVRRHGELRTDIPDVSQKVLTETLRRLERDGLVVREERDEHPPHVRYHLTELGEAAQGLLSVICQWGKRHLVEVGAARAAFDSAWPRSTPPVCLEWSGATGARER